MKLLQTKGTHIHANDEIRQPEEEGGEVLLPASVRRNDNKRVIKPLKYCVKRANAFMCISTGRLRFLDITQYTTRQDQYTVQGDHGETVLYEPHHLEFVPLRYNNLHQVEIYVRTDTGLTVPFEFGKCVTTLYIRRERFLDK